MVNLSHTQNRQNKQKKKQFKFFKLANDSSPNESFAYKICAPTMWKVIPYTHLKKSVHNPFYQGRFCTALQQNNSLPQLWLSFESSFQSGQSVHTHLSCIFLLRHKPIVDKLQKTAASAGCSRSLEGKAIDFRQLNRPWHLRSDKKARAALTLTAFYVPKVCTRREETLPAISCSWLSKP